MNKENSTVNCETDPPQLNEYSWGAGIIQQTLCMDSDGDTIRSEKYYDGTYYGLIEEDGGIFKLFTLTVKYGEESEKVDELAKKAAQLVSETTLGQL